jgi:hypothetical protein
MIAGCYVLHLYCRFAPESPEALAPPDKTQLSGRAYDSRHNNGALEFSGETLAETRRHARAAGWRFGRDGEVTCPTCLKHGPGYEQIERKDRTKR